MPTLSAHVPDDWEFKESFSLRISGKPYRGKPGPYIRDLIERDLTNEKRGGAVAGHSPEQISEWIEVETAVLKAAPFALKVLQSENLAEQVRAAKQLAQLVVETSLRKPKKTGAGADYPVRLPVRTPRKAAPEVPVAEKKALGFDL